MTINQAYEIFETIKRTQPWNYLKYIDDEQLKSKLQKAIDERSLRDGTIIQDVMKYFVEKIKERWTMGKY